MTALVDHVQYNNLPSLKEAHVAIQTPSVESIINGPIRDVFLKHAAHLTLCLYLQHRHHTVGDDQAVVKVDGTAHLMDDQVLKDIASFGNKVVPTTWMSSGGKVLPMEFSIVCAANTSPAPTPEFIMDFLAVLHSNKCDGLFGIDTIAERDWTEMNIGDASVVVPSDDRNGYNQEKFIPVAFTFDNKEPKFRVHGKCNVTHKHTSKPTGGTGTGTGTK